MSALLRKYGVATTLVFPMIKRGVVDFAVSADWTPATGDLKISKDEGADANTGSLCAAVASAAGKWSLALTATEMQAARIHVTVIDSATKAVEDQSILIETYGNASAQHAVDLNDSVRAGLTSLPNASMGATGGHGAEVVQGGTASAGAASSITLAAAASTTVDLYKGQTISIFSGTGAGQTRVITAYSSGRVATVDWNWVVTPDNTSVYEVKPVQTPKLNSSMETTAASVTGAVGSVTGNVGGNVTGSVGSVASGGIAAASFAAGAINAAAIATDALGAAELAADAVTEIADGVWNAIRSTHLAAGSFGEANQLIRSGTAQAGAGGSITLDAGASGSDNFYVACILLITGGTGAGQSRFILGYTGATKVATVNGNWLTSPDSTSQFSILPFGTVPVVSQVSGAVGSVTGAVGSVASGGITAGSFTAGAIDATAIATDAIGSAELAASAISEIAVQVWDEVLASHLTSGSTGAALNGAGAAGDPWGTTLPGAYGAGSAGNIIGNRLDAAVTTRLAPTVAARTLDVAATGEAGLDFDNIKDATGAHTLTNITVPLVTTTATATGVTNDVGITQAAADKVWLTTARTLTAFSTALAVSVWDVLAASVATASSIGLQLKTNIDAAISSRLATAGYTTPPTAAAIQALVAAGPVASVTGAVGSVTGAVGSVTGNVGGNVVGSTASVTGAVGSVTGNVGGNVTGSVGSLGATAKGDVKTQVTDSLNVDTQTELTAVPSSTPTYSQMLRWLYLLGRNKIKQTATAQTVRNNADGADVGTATVGDDGTTATRGKFA